MIVPVVDIPSLANPGKVGCDVGDSLHEYNKAKATQTISCALNEFGLNTSLVMCISTNETEN
jgi:hypothetical protein